MSDVIQLREIPKQDPDVIRKKFIGWLENAIKGDKFCYYFGAHIIGQPVGRVALRAYEDGLITMYQKREGKKFAYWAERLGVMLY